MRFRYLIISLLFSIVILSCKNKKPQESTNNLFKFKNYISYTTSGVVSVAEPIAIRLAKEVKGWQPQQEISEDLIRISPKIEGKLTVLNTRSLLFQPSKNLKPNTEYTVSVQLDDLFPNIPSENKKYTFKFKTIEQNFAVNTSGFQSYNKEWQYVEGTIKTADILLLEDAKKLISATQKSKKLAIKWEESDSVSRHFQFKIDSIQRFEEDSEVLFSWNGKPINVDNKGKTPIKIIGKSNFSIVNVNVVQAPEQYLKINFSDPLKKQQNFNGLVLIKNTKNLKFIVEGNNLKVYPNKHIAGNVLVDVFQGIKNVDGYKLKTPFSKTVAFEQVPPEVRFISSGVILPNSNNLKVNFEAVNLKAVDVRVIKIFEDNVLQFLQENNLGSGNRYNIRRVGRRIAKKTITLATNGIENTGKWKAYAVDLSKLIKADPGAIYRVELSLKPEYSLYKCDGAIISSNSSEEYYEDDYYYNEEQQYSQQESDDLDEREEQYWDNLIYNYNNHYYNWSDRENPCKEAYYLNNDRTVSTNILASNLGVIAKKGENKSYFFAVTDILTTNPIADAKISLYNYQQQEITKTTTNTKGIATANVGKNAYFAIASKGKNKTYIKLDDGHSLSLSKFNVSGKKLQKGLKGFIYGERGVWRPGDSIHLTFVLNDNANKLPKEHPIKLEVTDARGKLTFKKMTTNNVNGMYKFTVPTSSSDPTGNWNSTVSVGGAKFHKSLKVETVKPNRLKIKIDFKDNVLLNNKPIKGTLNVKWLHGAPAKSIKTEVNAKFTATSTAFKKYPKYIFNDPTRKFYAEEVTIFNGNLDATGNRTISKKVNLKNKAPGMLNVAFLTKAFENGGDFSMDVISKKYAPYTSFVGIKLPKPKRYSSYETDKNIEFNIASATAEGNAKPNTQLEVQIFQIKWRWWWSSSYDDLSSYNGTSYRKPYKKWKITTDATGKGTFKINIPDRSGGRYLIRVIDKKSGHATGATVYFYKNWWKTPTKDPETSKMLVFSADKEKYNVGEMAKITFPSGTEGRALISIENGTEVLKTFWKKTQKGETNIEIPITKEMTPNVFVNISLLQPHASTANDLPLRLYGVIPLLVEDSSTRLAPQISMPKVLKPEENFTVKVSEKNGKRMSYTIAVVEEGLLDLTRYKTPQIWNAFYTREALGVKTWDIFDDVIGAYGGKLEQVFAIGGDADATGGKNKKANRFKPVVRVLGPFTLMQGKTALHNIKLPKYIGSVRTMVVAADNSKAAYGKAEETTPVRKPLMVLATLPRKLSPGEKVTLPVTVFAMENKVKNITVSLKLSDGIKVVGKKTQKLTFANPDEKMAYFNLDVSEAKGIGKVEVIAQGNGEKSSYKVEIDVVNPNPVSSKAIAVELEPNATQTINFETFGIKGSNTATIEFSTLPAMDFSRRMDYLIRYPHGCVEQTTSSVFPQLFLSDIIDLPIQKKQEITKNIEKGIERLGNFQLTNGGLSYWIGQNSANDWGTSYAGHFMIEASKKGYVLPITFITNWLKYQKQAARNWRAKNTNYNSDLAQAYRLYTLALAGYPDLSSMNRLRENNTLSNNAKWRLAATYALAGQKEVATKIANTANINFENRRDYYTYGSVDRNRAMAMETMLLIDDNQSRELAKFIAKRLSSNSWMSTQTTAYSLLSMAKMVEINGGKAMKLQYSLNNKNKNNITTKFALSQQKLAIVDGENSISITNEAANLVFVTILNSGILPLGKEILEKRGLSVNVAYKDTQGKTINVSKLAQGTEFEAEVTVGNLKAEEIHDIALTEIFPSGWEIINTRFTDFGDSTSSAKANFTDIRDDRVHFYFDLGKNKTKTFKVLLNASYLGTYYLYGLQAEAMYDNDYFTRTTGKWIEVIK